MRLTDEQIAEIEARFAQHDEFVRHAKTDIPALIAEIDRLRAELQRSESNTAAILHDLSRIADDYHPDTPRDAEQALEEMREALGALVENAADAGRKILDEMRRKDERIKQLEDRLRDVISCIHFLAEESDGVIGLHRNGDIATWDDLLLGKLNAWLGIVIEEALDALEGGKAR